jgi:hypothetical protein
VEYVCGSVLIITVFSRHLEVIVGPESNNFKYLHTSISSLLYFPLIDLTCKTNLELYYKEGKPRLRTGIKIQHVLEHARNIFHAVLWRHNALEIGVLLLALI